MFLVLVPVNMVNREKTLHPLHRPMRRWIVCIVGKWIAACYFLLQFMSLVLSVLCKVSLTCANERGTGVKG